MTVTEQQIIDILKTVYDPEIPVSIYELGLVYDIKIDDSGSVNIKMTLTTPNCPAAASLPAEVENKVKSIPGASDARVEIVWEPLWNPAMMTDAARLQLGL